MSDPKGLIDALTVLRSSADPAGRSLEWAWRVISRTLDGYGQSNGPSHREDIRQRGLIKVLKHVHRFEGDHERSAQSWLRRVHRTAVSDYYRLRGRRELERALSREDADPLETVAAPEPVGWTDPTKLEGLMDTILDCVHEWLATRPITPTKRLGDARRAQVALMANVCGLGLEAIRSEAGLPSDTPSNAGLSKWIERGRETVLLPALEAWDDPIAAPLTEILLEARRGDAGRERPNRRAVSRREDDPSEPVKDDR